MKKHECRSTSLQASANISVNGPGISHAVANISSLSYMMPMVEYSGNTMISIPGNPILVPLTMSHIFWALAYTSSVVWRRGMGYWKTQTPTVSGELEMSPWRDMMMMMMMM